MSQAIALFSPLSAAASAASVDLLEAAGPRTSNGSEAYAGNSGA